MKKYTAILICFLILPGLAANNIKDPGSARSTALSGASVALCDHWAVFHNQAALATLHSFSFGIYGENRFNIKELNSISFAMAFSLNKAGAFGLGIYQMNNSVISRHQRLGLAYALQVSKSVYAGIQLNYLHNFAELYGSNNSICGEVSLLYSISPEINLGINIFNPGAAGYQGLEKEKIPSVYRFGMAYQMSEESLILLETQHGSGRALSFHSGFEYQIKNTVKLLFGFRSKPLSFSFGLTVGAARININTAFQYHQELGSTPGLGFDYINK
jgi:hypothetical protein